MFTFINFGCRNIKVYYSILMCFSVFKIIAISSPTKQSKTQHYCIAFIFLISTCTRTNSVGSLPHTTGQDLGGTGLLIYQLHLIGVLRIIPQVYDSFNVKCKIVLLQCLIFSRILSLQFLSEFVFLLKPEKSSFPRKFWLSMLIILWGRENILSFQI